MSINTTTCFPTLASAPRWEAYGAPCPSIESHTYEVDAGLIRTEMDSGFFRQRRKYTSRQTKFRLTWRVNQAQLRTLEKSALAIGYDWFYLPLVSGQVSKFYAIDHPVRFISNLQVSLSARARRTTTRQFVTDAVWDVSVEAEQYQFNNSCMEGKLPAV